MSNVDPRDNSPLFSNNYLKSTNRDIADTILWPVPILQQQATLEITIGNTTISPGDVLEVVDGSLENYLLVTAIENPDATDSILICYSTNTQQIEILRQSPLAEVRGQPKNIDHSDTTSLVETMSYIYAVHSNVVDPVDDDPVATVSWIPDAPTQASLGDPKRVPGYYPYSNPPTPMDTTYPKAPYLGENEACYGSIEVVTDTLLQGDALEELQKLPDDSVHTAITSPPYPGNQRDYDVDGQIGIEETTTGYLEHLLPIIIEMMNTVREDGTGWIIIDDVINEGEYAVAVDRLTAQMREEGFKIIHNGPWTKEGGGMPDPAPNRFGHQHERVIGIANTEDYYFNRRAVEDQTDVFTHPASSESTHSPPEDSDVSHDAKFSVEIASHILKAATPDRICPECHTPFEPEFEVTDILDVTCHHRENVQANFEKADITRDHARACRAVGIAGSGQGARTQTGSGRNSDETEELLEEVRESSFPSSYEQCFSTARKEYVGSTQACECDIDTPEEVPGGIALDSFVGVGTSCIAAQKQQKQYIGIDLNGDYLERARAWLRDGCQSDLFDYE